MWRAGFGNAYELLVRQKTVWMNEGSFRALRAWRKISLLLCHSEAWLLSRKSLISITNWVKSNPLIFNYGKNVQLLLGQPIFMPYIYNLLLPHLLNLSWVDGAANPRILNKCREKQLWGGAAVCTSGFVAVAVFKKRIFELLMTSFPRHAQTKICATLLFIKPLSNRILKVNLFEFAHENFPLFPNCTYKKTINTKFHQMIAVTGCYFTLPCFFFFFQALNFL